MERTRVPSALKAVGGLVADFFIRTSVTSHFQAIYARIVEPPARDRPTIIFANHHYWWDGYLCYLLGKQWKQPMTLWMEQWRWFPPFWALGALPYPSDDTLARARTIRQTVRRLQNPPHVLFLFPEGTLHAGYHLLPFKRSLFWLAQHVAHVQILPLAIVISPTLHQYPRAFLHLGRSFQTHALVAEQWLAEAQQKTAQMVEALRREAECLDTAEKSRQAGFTMLVQGKASVNERWWARIIP
ncbi:MAG: lysophospholipid acyltransferase family protein [Armatimonadota bacterium]